MRSQDGRHKVDTGNVAAYFKANLERELLLQENKKQARRISKDAVA